VTYFVDLGATPCFSDDVSAFLDIAAGAPAAVMAAAPAALAAALTDAGLAEAAAAAAAVPDDAALPLASALMRALEAQADAASVADAATGKEADVADRVVRRGCALEATRLRLGLVGALPDAALAAHAAALAARFLAYEAVPPLSGESARYAAEVARYNEGRNHLELKVADDKPAPRPTSNDALLLSAAAAYLLLAGRHAAHATAAAHAAAAEPHRVRERAAVIDAVLLLELGAGANEDNADARLWLTRLYTHPAVGAVGRARDYSSEAELRVRSAQCDSMSHLWLGDALRWGRYKVAREVAGDNTEFSDSFRSDNASLTSTAYLEENYAQVRALSLSM
jgi:hypothetical protein